jgi:hypothetical protein
LTLGAGVTTATNVTSLGTLVSNGIFTNLYCVGGQTTVNGAPSATTIDVTGGVLICAISGTTTNVLVGPGTLDATKDTTARTSTTATCFDIAPSSPQTIDGALLLHLDIDGLATFGDSIRLRAVTVTVGP